MAPLIFIQVCQHCQNVNVFSHVNDAINQGLPGDGHDRAGTHKHRQNNLWGVVAPVKKKV
jgi:hypothetical protein